MIDPRQAKCSAGNSFDSGAIIYGSVDWIHVGILLILPLSLLDSNRIDSATWRAAEPVEWAQIRLRDARIAVRCYLTPLSDSQPPRISRVPISKRWLRNQFENLPNYNAAVLRVGSNVSTARAVVPSDSISRMKSRCCHSGQALAID